MSVRKFFMISFGMSVVCISSNLYAGCADLGSFHMSLTDALSTVEIYTSGIKNCKEFIFQRLSSPYKDFDIAIRKSTEATPSRFYPEPVSRKIDSLWHCQEYSKGECVDKIRMSWIDDNQKLKFENHKVYSWPGIPLTIEETSWIRSRKTGPHGRDIIVVHSFSSKKKRYGDEWETSTENKIGEFDPLELFPNPYIPYGMRQGDAIMSKL